MTNLTFEAVIALLTGLIEEFREAIAQCEAMLAQLIAQGQTAADELNDMNLVGG